MHWGSINIKLLVRININYFSGGIFFMKKSIFIVVVSLMLTGLCFAEDAETDKTKDDGKTDIAKTFSNENGLLWAVRFGSIKYVNYFISKGANINAVDSKNRSALYLASNLGNIEILKILISNGADLNTQDDDGWTALIWATSQNYYEIVKLLIDNGADTNIQNNIDGWTALMIAAFLGYEEIVNYLINHDADINIKDKSGKTAKGLANKDLKSIVSKNIKQIEIFRKNGQLIEYDEFNVDIYNSYKEAFINCCVSTLNYNSKKDYNFTKICTKALQVSGIILAIEKKEEELSKQ